MKVLLSLLLFSPMLSWASAFPAAQNSSPLQLAATMARTSGIAPLAVQMDAIGSISPSTSTPSSVSMGMHEIAYSWNFGDCATSTGAATWDNGATPNVNRKCEAIGPVAGHVYETPGTYAVTLTANDGVRTNTISAGVVVVTDPDTQFPTTNTICIYNTSLGTGCPSGADSYQATNFHTAMGVALTTGAHAPYHRILFKRGDAFTTGTTTELLITGPGMVGAYGSQLDARPTVTATANSVVILSLAKASSYGQTDWRFVDLEFIGNGTDNGVGAIIANLAFSQVTILRCYAHGMNKGFFLDDLSQDQEAIVDSRISNITGAGGSLGVYLNLQRSMILGNLFDNSYGGEHSLRIQSCYRCAVTDNTAQGAGAGAGSKHAFTLRSAVHNQAGYSNSGDTQYVTVNNNKFTGSPGGAYTVFIGPEAADDERIIDVIYERNWTVAESGQTEALHLSHKERMTVRDNVFDLTGASSHTGVNVRHYATTVYPNITWIYNNTVWSGDTDNDFDGVEVSSLVTNTIVRNNIFWSPSDSVHAPVTCNGSQTLTTCVNAPGLLVQSNNSSSTQTHAASTPFIDASPSAPSDFQPCSPNSATCYATGGGTSVPVWADFFGTAWGGAWEIGAVKH